MKVQKPERRQKSTDPIPVLLGPTGTGKTELLARLPFRDSIEVISCDSRQIYAGIPIGTAQPDARTIEEIPHHLVGFLSPLESYSAGGFRRDVDRLVEDIRLRGKIPLLCGGTAFYFRAISTRMIDISERDDIRLQVEAMSHEERLALLREKDDRSVIVEGEVASRGRVHPNDLYRVTRALLVLLQTGRPMRSYYEEGFSQRSDISFQGVWFDIPLSEWTVRIESRARQMIQQGLVEEANVLFNQFGSCPAMKTPGYQEALAFSSGRISRQDFEESLIRAHLQYGRRQRAWLRRESSLVPSGSAEEAVRFLEKLMAPIIRD